MKKKNLLLVLIFVLLTIASIVYDFVLGLDLKYFDFTQAKGIVVSLAIIIAIIFALIEKNYLAAIVISLVKIVVGFADKFLIRVAGIVAAGKINFSDASIQIGLLNTLLIIFAAFLIYKLLKEKQFQFEAPSFKTIIWPFIVLLFYAIFKNSADGFKIALVELLALILVAHVSESLLRISAFLFVPFDLLSNLVSSPGTITTSLIIEWSIGGVILIAAIIRLVINLRHWLHQEPPLKKIAE